MVRLGKVEFGKVVLGWQSNAWLGVARHGKDCIRNDDQIFDRLFVCRIIFSTKTN